jgi:hypothetical protein
MIKVTNKNTGESLSLDSEGLKGPSKFLSRAAKLAKAQIEILHPDYQMGILKLDPKGSLPEKVGFLRIVLDPVTPWKNHLRVEYTGDDLFELQTGQRPEIPKEFAKVKPVRKPVGDL